MAIKFKCPNDRVVYIAPSGTGLATVCGKGIGTLPME